MTDNPKTPSSRHPDARKTFQDATARFSGLARPACTEGPQRVTVPGHDAVAVISASGMERPPPYANKTAPFVAFMESLEADGLDLTRDWDTGRDAGL